MDLRIIFYGCLVFLSDIIWTLEKSSPCLTGYMTDVQTWVDSMGVITNNVDYHTVIDLSANLNPVPVLQQKMTIMRTTGGISVKYLSMARCRLNRVPTVFQFRDPQGRDLADTVEYMTFYGNNFQDMSSPGEQYDVRLNATRARARIVGVSVLGQSNAAWSTGFQKTKFPHLKELDLRACSIQVLTGHIFTGMSNLEALYIGENEVVYVDANAFAGLQNLIHLDFSRNEAFDDSGNLVILTTETFYILEPLENLASLDLSYTKMTNRYAAILSSLGPKLTRLSLCEVGWTSLAADIFNQTSLKILDLTGNSGVLSRPNVLRGLEGNLEVLYAEDTRLRTTNSFLGFRRLEILGLAMNEVNAFNSTVAKTLTSLKILDLDKNRLSSWPGDVFTHMLKLELLTLKDNNINVISEEMIQDIANVTYVAVSGNFIVCNCHSRDLFDLALRNEQVYDRKAKQWPEIAGGSPLKVYHRAYIEFNSLVKHRERVSFNCMEEESCSDDLQDDVEGNFLLLDFHPSSYMCLQVPEGRSVQFSEVIGCNRISKDVDYDKVIAGGRNKLYILLTLPILLMVLAVVFAFRRNIRYFLITMRNSALLSVINKNEVLDECAIFHYDVFVSYCNLDRPWVLDHLLPRLETDCSVSACLHERDFQVGHSILENIVSCMDRSRSIMLIISQQFLLSQWCQFEMHLAQHRLLETRREDLTLVLLEEIPRRLRPNTLQYLMLTKTYIVWPGAESERALFWRRVKKSLINMKMKQSSVEGVSLA